VDRFAQSGHSTFRMRTTSEVEVPWEMARLLVGDQLKEKISSARKLVIFFGSPPAIGWLYMSARPSTTET